MAGLPVFRFTVVHDVGRVAALARVHAVPCGVPQQERRNPDPKTAAVQPVHCISISEIGCRGFEHDMFMRASDLPYNIPSAARHQRRSSLCISVTAPRGQECTAATINQPTRERMLHAFVSRQRCSVARYFEEHGAPLGFGLPVTNRWILHCWR